MDRHIKLSDDEIDALITTLETVPRHPSPFTDVAFVASEDLRLLRPLVREWMSHLGDEK